MCCIEIFDSQDDMADSGPAPRVRSYGAMKALVHSFALTLLTLAGFVAMPVAAASAQTAAPLKIVAFGDSLTAGYGLSAQDAFPARLQAALKARGHNVEIENAGVSGDTAGDGLARLDWSVPDGTDAVIVELGANDMLRGFDPAMTKQTLAAIVAPPPAPPMQVLIAGMLATPSLGAPFKAQFDAIYPALAAKYGTLLFPFFLDGVAGQPKMQLPDGLHPSRAGVDVIVARILPSVEALLKQAGP